MIRACIWCGYSPGAAKCISKVNILNTYRLWIMIDDWIWIVVRMDRFKISERYTQILKIVTFGYKDKTFKKA